MTAGKKRKPVKVDAEKEMAGFISALVLGTALLAWVAMIAIPIYIDKADKARELEEARESLSAELDTTYAATLNKHAITSVHASWDGLRFVADGRTFCLLDLETTSTRRYNIVRDAERVGCGAGSEVLLLNAVEGEFRRNELESYRYAGRKRISFNLNRPTGGRWQVDLEGTLLERGKEVGMQAGGELLNIIDGFYVALASHPELLRTPQAIQDEATAQ